MGAWRRIGGHRVAVDRDGRVLEVRHPSGERTCHLERGLDLFADFTARPVDRVLQLEAPGTAPDPLWVLGRLASVFVGPGRGIRRPLRPRPWLCADGRCRLWSCGQVAAPWLTGPVELAAVEYDSDKWSGRMTRYRHRFEKPRPTLTRSRDGFLLIRGGAYTVTARGIEG